MASSDEFDVVVVGGRCAGAPLAMLLARAGVRVLLVDKKTFPSDTLSGHNLQFAGTAALSRWGLYERVVSTGCPPMTHYFGGYGDLALRGAPPVQAPGDPAASLCVRRTLLDHLLIQAAIEAGAEFRESYCVTELLRENDRVVGVKSGSDAIRAAVVVGADGMRSSIARHVGAEIERRIEPLTFLYYSYWEGLESRPGAPAGEIEAEGWWGFRTDEGRAPGEGMLAIALPTNAGAKAVMLVRPVSEFSSFKGDLQRNFMSAIDRTPLGQRLRAAKQVERFYGTSDTPNFFRRAVGPGWALVGDASFFKDPIVGHGISDAFVWAEILAQQILVGLQTGGMDDALAAYAARRDREGLASYNVAVAAAKMCPLTPQSRPLMEALSRDPIEAGRYFGAVMTQSVDPGQFFSLPNLVRVIGKSRAPAPLHTTPS